VTGIMGGKGSNILLLVVGVGTLLLLVPFEQNSPRQ
jgi:hypothetical protein